MSDEDRVQQLGGERTAERFAWTVMFTSGGGRDQEQLKWAVQSDEEVQRRRKIA